MIFIELRDVEDDVLIAAEYNEETGLWDIGGDGLWDLAAGEGMTSEREVLLLICEAAIDREMPEYSIVRYGEDAQAA